MLLLGLFGLLGPVIAGVGVYGVMAYLVAQRTREISVRMALGATRSSVVRMVLVNAAVLVAAASRSAASRRGITADKKVVWALRDWTVIGPASSTQLLDQPGVPERRQR